MISLVIPVFNEANFIGKTLNEILQYLNRKCLEFEIIIVNDGSKDNTVKVIENFIEKERRIRILNSRKNRGKGNAVRRGMLEAEGDIVLFTDADLSTPIAELEKLLPWFSQGYDVVIGSRKLPKSHIVVHQNFYREKMGIFYSRLSRLVLGFNVIDFTCGFKAFSSEAAREIFTLQSIERWSFDSEILFIANRRGYQIKEVPVDWFNDPLTRVRLRYDVLGSLIGLIKIRWRALRGAYDRTNSPKALQTPIL